MDDNNELIESLHYLREALEIINNLAVCYRDVHDAIAEVEAHTGISSAIPLDLYDNQERLEK